MSDDVVMDVGKHALSSGGAVGLFAILTRWLESKKAEQAREEFILLRADVKQLIADVQEHKQVFEDVVTIKNAVKALGEKFDDTKTSLRIIDQRTTAMEQRAAALEQRLATMESKRGRK